MELNKALSQLTEIHDHLSKSQTYRGITSLPVAIAGLFALIAASAQQYFVEENSPDQFVIYWSSVALITLFITIGVVLYKYFYRESNYHRKLTLKVVGQFFPSIVAGFIVSIALSSQSREFIPFLPGIWTLLFALGILAARPYLPRLLNWVTFFFFCASIQLFLMAPSGESLSPWGMGLSFGIGLILSSILLFWSLERPQNVTE